MLMEGINYVLDDKNERIAVQIDLTRYGEIWEDFYDSLIAEMRKSEEKIPLQDLIRELKSEGKLAKDV
ncbi:MAG: hypothetical protein ACK5DD_10760 [Cyclobacteriaceae bacterium]|jgi:hypothetical protein